MNFTISNEILEKYPNLNIALVVAKGIENAGDNEKITAMLREAEKEIRENYDSETLSQQPKIKSWRETYSSFGAKPKKYRCSVENLYRMVLDGVELRHINKIVDIYNYISIKHMLPAGGDDLDKVDGNITLGFAKGDEQFTELNSDETKNPKEGEVIYSDDKEVLCRRWNWRECDKSKMTENTKNVAIVIEGLPPFTAGEIRSISDELAALVREHCGGIVEIHILGNENPSAEINI